MMLLLMLCFFQIQRFCCFCHLRDVHMWIPWKFNSWFQMPEGWAILKTTQNPTICSHVCNHWPGYLSELPSSDLSQWMLLGDRQQKQSRQLSFFVVQALSLERHNDATHDAVFLPNPTVCCFCHSRACSRMNCMKAQLVISDARALSHIDNNTESHHWLTPLQSLARIFVWASVVVLAHKGSLSETGSKCSPDSFRHQWSCFITRMSQWCFSRCCVSSKSNGFAASVIREDAHVSNPWKLS